MLKRCSKCGFEKDIMDFYRSKATKDGYQSRCKKCALKHRKEYYEKNKDKIREYWGKYSQTEKGRIVIARKEKKYLQSPKGKIVRARRVRKYEQSPNGKMAIKRKSHKRRVHMKCTETTLTSGQWVLIIKMQNTRCNICKQKFTKSRLPTMDHIIPVSKGGGLTFENAQALCRSCNSTKNAKLDLGFIQTWSHRQ